MADAAIMSMFAHGFSELALAMRMSMLNAEQMKVARAAATAGGSAKEAAAKFLRGTYYKSWSRAQLNNTEYAPMLALLCFAIKYKADKEERGLSYLEKVGCLSSVVFSYMFAYAAANQGKVDVKNMRPGQAGMSPLRPLGALGRYAAMALLLWLLIRRTPAHTKSLPAPTGDAVSAI
jgi:hypothetical protein